MRIGQTGAPVPLFSIPTIHNIRLNNVVEGRLTQLLRELDFTMTSTQQHDYRGPEQGKTAIMHKHASLHDAVPKTT